MVRYHKMVSVRVVREGKDDLHRHRSYVRKGRHHPARSILCLLEVEGREEHG